MWWSFDPCSFFSCVTLHSLTSWLPTIYYLVPVSSWFTVPPLLYFSLLFWFNPHRSLPRLIYLSSIQPALLLSLSARLFVTCTTPTLQPAISVWLCLLVFDFDSLPQPVLCQTTLSALCYWPVSVLRLSIGWMDSKEFWILDWWLVIVKGHYT